MAKRQAGLKELPPEPAEYFVAAEGVPPEPAAAPEVPAGPPRWRVALNCPTPLAHPELVVEAANETEAWDKFMAANGICGSQHDRTIQRLS